MSTPFFMHLIRPSPKSLAHSSNSFLNTRRVRLMRVGLLQQSRSFVLDTPHDSSSFFGEKRQGQITIGRGETGIIGRWSLIDGCREAVDSLLKPTQRQRVTWSTR